MKYNFGAPRVEQKRGKNFLKKKSDGIRYKNLKAYTSSAKKKKKVVNVETKKIRSLLNKITRVFFFFAKTKRKENFVENIKKKKQKKIK